MSELVGPGLSGQNDRATRGRVRAVAVDALLVVALGLLVVAVAIREGRKTEGGLRIAYGPAVVGGRTDLIVYVDAADNRPALGRGRRSVYLECFDDAGRLAVRARRPWPLTETDGGKIYPHIDQTLGIALVPASRAASSPGLRDR